MNLVKCKAFSATYFFAKSPSVIKIKPMQGRSLSYYYVETQSKLQKKGILHLRDFPSIHGVTFINSTQFNSNLFLQNDLSFDLGLSHVALDHRHPHDFLNEKGCWCCLPRRHPWLKSFNLLCHSYNQYSEPTQT